MGTHPIFESDFDCLTDCQARRFSMAKKETEAKLEQSVKVEKVIASPPISLRTRNGSLKTTIVKDCHVPERVKLDLDEGSGDAPTELDGESNIVGKIGETEIG